MNIFYVMQGSKLLQTLLIIRPIVSTSIGTSDPIAFLKPLVEVSKQRILADENHRKNTARASSVTIRESPHERQTGPGDEGTHQATRDVQKMQLEDLQEMANAQSQNMMNSFGRPPASQVLLSQPAPMVNAQSQNMMNSFERPPAPQVFLSQPIPMANSPSAASQIPIGINTIRNGIGFNFDEKDNNLHPQVMLQSSQFWIPQEANQALSSLQQRLADNSLTSNQALSSLQQRLASTSPNVYSPSTMLADRNGDEPVGAQPKAIPIDEEIETEVKRRVQNIAQTMAADEAHRLSLMSKEYESNGHGSVDDRKSASIRAPSAMDDTALRARLQEMAKDLQPQLNKANSVSEYLNRDTTYGIAVLSLAMNGPMSINGAWSVGKDLQQPQGATQLLQQDSKVSTYRNPNGLPMLPLMGALPVPSQSFPDANNQAEFFRGETGDPHYKNYMILWPPSQPQLQLLMGVDVKDKSGKQQVWTVPMFDARYQQMLMYGQLDQSAAYQAGQRMIISVQDTLVQDPFWNDSSGDMKDKAEMTVQVNLKDEEQGYEVNFGRSGYNRKPIVHRGLDWDVPGTPR